MMWLTWRQSRMQAWAALAVLAVTAAALVFTGPQLHELYRSSGLAACTTGCTDLAENFLGEVRAGRAVSVYWAGIGAMLLLPALIGIFWGAPLLSRELETGTYRLVWNQSVTRTRWLVVKLVGVGAAVLLTAGLLSLGVTWWAGPIDAAYDNRILPEMFVTRGIVPMGYAALAFVAGVAVGMLIRRAIPAMAATLVLVAAVQLAVPLWVRPLLADPVSSSAALNAEAIDSFGLHPDGSVTVLAQPLEVGSWVLENRTVTAAGTLFTGPADQTKCGRAGSPRECFGWLATQNLRQEISYVPAARFWTLQWREAGLLLAVALLISGVCVWWVRRRLD
jgi:hypothetical protein